MEIRSYYDYDVYTAPDYKVIKFSSDDTYVAANFLQVDRVAHQGKYVYSAVLKDVYLPEPLSRLKEYIVTGEVRPHSRYGNSFIVTSIMPVIHTKKEEIIDFLCEIKNVGLKTAEKIYAHFGDTTFDVLLKDKNEIYKVLSGKTADNFIENFTLQYLFQEESNKLRALSLSNRRIKRLFEKYKDEAYNFVTDNPFWVSESGDISFIEANSIALEVKSDLHSPLRITQGICYVMKEKFRSMGHLFIDKETLTASALKLLNNGLDPDNFITKQEIEDAYVRGEGSHFKARYNNIYLFKDYFAEKRTAEELVKFVRYPHNKFNMHKDDCLRQIDIASKKFSFKLNDGQKNAVCTAMGNNISVITGGPGTGKSTLLKYIIEIFSNNYSANIKLCSPTGKAARRMAECAGFKEASTIHTLLDIQRDFQWSINDTNTAPVNSDLLVIDESSMLDMELMYLLISSVPFTSKIIFIGDVDQLPSVGPGSVLKEIIDSGIIPTAVLNQIYRQSEQSNIVKNSFIINKGETNIVFDKGNKPTDSFIIKRRADDINEQIASMYAKLIRNGNSVDDVQILTPYRSEKYPASTFYLNRLIQEKINPKTTNKAELVVDHNAFRVGDKVIQQVNDDEIKNGDTGTVLSVVPTGDFGTSIVIDFGFNRIVEYEKEDIIEFGVTLAYALTAHKSQGSEYKTVIIPMIDEHIPMLTKKLVYTALTRAKSHVVLVGNVNVLKKAVKNNNELLRNTILAKRMIRNYNGKK